MRVVIHSDSSPTIGSGHVARALALAEALRAAGSSVELAADELLEPHRSAAAALGVQVVERRVADRQPDWVVVDADHLGPAARSGLADDGVPRLVIDDLGAPAPDAALVVNANLYAGPGRPALDTEGEQLFGPSYALLRAEYTHAAAERAAPERVGRVLVTMGGADPPDATRVAIMMLAALEDRPTTRVVIGAAHPAASDRLADAHAAGFEAIVGPRSLRPHLAWSDLVVGACGTTVLETARLGRPLVGVVIAANQEPVASAVEAESLGVVAGRHPTLHPDQLRGAYDRLASDPVRRGRIAEIGPSLVDGRGARRVADALASGPLTLRPAGPEDSELLLAWRNDADARRASFDERAVDPVTHAEWLHARLGDPHHRIYVGEVGGAPIGVVRFALDDRRATVSVALDAGRRGRGIGARLIRAGVVRLAREGAADEVDAWIRPDNAASIAAFTTAGFRPLAQDLPDRRLYRQRLSPVG